jgi:hypothetical protein
MISQQLLKSVRAELVEALFFFQIMQKGQPLDRLRANGT